MKPIPAMRIHEQYVLNIDGFSSFFKTNRRKTEHPAPGDYERNQNDPEVITKKRIVAVRSAATSHPLIFAARAVMRFISEQRLFHATSNDDKTGSNQKW